ncbi:unnamed protein product [Auanema sp. JU1783]|nr:unnamed protein product [Auanema sp. JU1783]
MEHWLVHLRWSKKHGFSSYPVPEIENGENGSCNEEQIHIDDEPSVADRSRCCCESIHIKNGAYAVAFFYALIIVSNLGIRAYKSEEVLWVLGHKLLFLISDSVSVVSLFYGVARRRPAFLQPFTVVSLLTISFCILLTVFYGAAAVNPTSFYGEQVEILLADKVQLLADTFSISQKDVVVSTATVTTLIYACTVVIHSWFMIIVVKCAQYFRDKYDETLTTTSNEDGEKPVSIMTNSIQINQDNINML